MITRRNGMDIDSIRKNSEPKLMCNDMIYDSTAMDKEEVMNRINATANGAKVSFTDEEMTRDHYWLKFRSLEGWSKNLRYFYGEWESK